MIADTLKGSHVGAGTAYPAEGVLLRTFKRLMSVLDHAAGCCANPLHALERIFESHVRFVTKNPGTANLLHHILDDPPQRVREHVRETMRAYEHEIAVIVQQAKRRELVRDDVDAETAATVFVSLLQAQMLRLQILGNAQGVRNEARAMLQLYLDGIRVTGGEFID